MKKFWRPLKLPSSKIFLFQNLGVCIRYHNIFFAILMIYFWSIHIANNLFLAISLGSKLNSNLKEGQRGAHTPLIFKRLFGRNFLPLDQFFAQFFLDNEHIFWH